MRRSNLPLWIGLLLIGAGILLVVVAWPRTTAPAVTPVPTYTPAPEVLIPTHTPTLTPKPPTPTRTPTLTPEPPTPTHTLTPTPEPIVPTRTPAELTATATESFTTPTSTPALEPTPEATETPQSPASAGLLWQGRYRWGVGVVVNTGPISRYDVAPLHLGWYTDWMVQSAPPRPGGVEYAQMIRLVNGALRPDAERIATIAGANPGSLWLVGNEPDVKWQDNVEPETYARLYYEAYTAIKAADPTAQVAIGGVSQPTPLRLRYLEVVLTAYRNQFGAEMPIDVWNVHNFILREERDSWGIDIPPGISDNQGVLYEIDDCDDLDIFRQQIVDFRQWMVAHGYQDRPLVVSEYGVLMPGDYGFPPERLSVFVAGTFDFFLTAVDPATGYPADGYRLVQRWCWYSMNAPEYLYPSGRLFDPDTREMTAVGEGWSGYVEGKLSP